MTALGGDDEAPVHESGIDISGAWIDGLLNLEGVSIPVSLAFRDCRFTDQLILRSTVLSGSLELSGSYLPGIRGDGLTCRGDLLFRDGFTSDKPVRLVGATVHGDIDLTDANLRCGPDPSLRLEGAVVRGSVYFRDGFSAVGSVLLTSTQVGHDVECDGATFDGWQAGGTRHVALSLKRCQIGGAFIARRTTLSDVSLADAHVKYLRDELTSWGTSITLDGFVYDSISHEAPTGFVARLAWLKKQPPQHLGERGQVAYFCPQPWQQLIRTLRTMGHKEDALEVGVAFEDHLRRIGKIGETLSTRSVRTIAYKAATRLGHRLFGLLAGYGYRPVRLLAWMFGVWVACAVLYWFAAAYGVFGPSNPLIFENPTYAECVSNSSVPDRNWYFCKSLKSEYSTFSPFAFSLDVLLPVINLRQEDSWTTLVQSPQTTVWAEVRTWHLSHAVRFVIWVENIFGWVSSLLLVATVSGFARRVE